MGQVSLVPEVSTDTNRAPCGLTRRLPSQPRSPPVASASKEERAAFEVRAPLRLQMRSAQACSQNAQAPPRSDFSKKCLSSRSPEHPGRVLGSLPEPRPPQVALRDRCCEPPPGSVLLPVLSPEPGRTEPGRAGPPGRGR